MDDKETLARGAEALMRRDALRASADAISAQVNILDRQARLDNDVYIDCALALAGIDGGLRRELTDEEKQRLVAARAMIDQHVSELRGQKPLKSS